MSLQESDQANSFYLQAHKYEKESESVLESLIMNDAHTRIVSKKK